MKKTKPKKKKLLVKSIDPEEAEILFLEIINAMRKGGTLSPITDFPLLGVEHKIEYETDSSLPPILNLSDLVHRIDGKDEFTTPEMAARLISLTKESLQNQRDLWEARGKIHEEKVKSDSYYNEFAKTLIDLKIIQKSRGYRLLKFFNLIP